MYSSHIFVKTNIGDKMKKYTIATIIIIITIIGFFTGIYLYKIIDVENNSNIEIAKEQIEDECTYLGEFAYNDNLISANSSEEKTSPNCVVVLKIYYEECGHIIEKKETIKDADVNLTEKELQERFPDWEIQKFTSSEIVLYKEVNDFCNEHYMVKEQDGYVVIFSIDKNNNKTFLEKTNISILYLEDEDLNKLKSGIYVESKKELNKILEDFE